MRSPEKSFLEEFENKKEFICTDSDPRNNKKFTEGLKRYLFLLTDHPFFVEQVTKIRKKFKVPKNGFASFEEKVVWKHSKNNYEAYRKEIERFLNKLNTLRVYRSGILEFIDDYIFFQKNHENISMSQTPRYAIIQSSNNREENKYLFQPNTLYLEVYPWTSTADMQDSFSKMSELKKDKMGYGNIQANEFGIARISWKLKQSGMKNTEIYEELKEKCFLQKMKHFGYDDISNYVTRYETSLKQIRDF